MKSISDICVGVPPIPIEFGYHGSFYDYFRNGTVNSVNSVDVFCHINEMKLNDFRIAGKIYNNDSLPEPTGNLSLSDVYLDYISIPFKYISTIDRKGIKGIDHPSCDLCGQNTQDEWSMASKDGVNYLYIYYYIPLFDRIVCPACFDAIYEDPSFLYRCRTVMDMIDRGELHPERRGRRVFYMKKPWDVLSVERANIIRRFGRYNKNAGEIIDSFYKFIKSNEKI